MEARIFGFIGLGTMGSILAARACSQGLKLVLYNRTATKYDARRYRGAIFVESPAAVAEQASIVFTALSDIEALKDVLFASSGLASSARPGTILCDLSTQSPAGLVEAAARARGAGIVVVEAPMAGSVHDAREGTLTFLTGGEREALSAVEPALLLFGKGCVYFGELGSANTAKLALNLLVGLMAQGLAEASSIVRHAGLPLREFLEVLGRSGLSSPLYARAGMRYLDQDFNPRFSLHNLRKDMRYANELAAQLGVSGPLMRSLGEQLESLSGAELSLDYSYLLARVLKT